MARYHSDNRIANTQQALAVTYKTQVQIWSATATLRRGRAVALQVGPDGVPNPSDCQIVYNVQRATADGTSSAFTPNPLFPGDVATSMVAHNAYTVEGTTALSIWTRSLNQRASMQWAAQDDQAMLLWPATNLAGLALMALSPNYTGGGANVLFGMEHEDL